MSPLSAVIWYFEFVFWFMAFCAAAGIIMLPFSLLYSYFTRNKE